MTSQIRVILSRQVIGISSILFDLTGYVTLNLDKRWKWWLEFPILKSSSRSISSNASFDVDLYWNITLHSFILISDSWYDTSLSWSIPKTMMKFVNPIFSFTLISKISSWISSISKVLGSCLTIPQYIYLGLSFFHLRGKMNYNDTLKRYPSGMIIVFSSIREKDLSST